MIVEIKIPVIGESITEAIIAEWKKSEGDYVEEDEILCLIESEKATLEVPADKSGVLSIKAASGETKNIGDIIALIDTSKSETKIIEDKVKDVDQSETVKDTAKKVFSTSVAKQILVEKNIPLESVKGTGDAGRITKQDALNYIFELEKKQNSSVDNDVKAEISDPVETRKKMTSLRKTIARNLVAAKNETAMLTTINEVDMSAILDMRKELNDEFQNKYGIKLGFMSLFGKAVCLALKDMEIVNARVEGDEIVYSKHVDLSIAVSTPKGLVVPVIRKADSMNLAQLEKSIQDIAEKARSGKLTLAEMTGGTFTITNGGVFGSLISTPIINLPQSAVLGMHTIQERPVAIDSKVVIRPMMYIALSYDHRIIDGSNSVLFIVHVKSLLENPKRMLLEI